MTGYLDAWMPMAIKGGKDHIFPADVSLSITEFY